MSWHERMENQETVSCIRCKKLVIVGSICPTCGIECKEEYYQEPIKKKNKG